MPDELKDSEIIWNSCLDEIKKQLPKQSFETWLKPTRAVCLTDTEITVEVPNQFFSDWVEDRYLENIKSVLKAVAGKPYSIKFQVKDQLFSEPASLAVRESAAPVKRKTPYKGQEQLNPKYTFDHFVVGNSNQFAHAAALAVAEAPGKTAFNPLVIYSDVGLGKTHLLQAIGNFSLTEETATRVVYISSEQFISEFIESIQKSKSSEFSNYYRNTDILLIDDIQFLTGKDQTQEAFFHTFNTLHHNGKQIVLTSDRPPKELKGLEERLISRFQWGLLVDIQAPDLETRIAILKKKASLENITLSDEVYYFVANNIDSNIRELEGAFIKLTGYARLTNQPITTDLAKNVLKDIISTKKKLISIEFVQKAVSEYLNIQEDKLRAKVRKKEIAVARQVAMFMAKKFTNSSLKTIGLHFGGRDHSTVIHALKIIEEKLEKDAAFKDLIDKISQIILQAKE